MKTYNYIYLITNKINSKIYIGKHSTDNLDDGYMGSGKLISKAIQKYGIENFTKEYLAFCDIEETLNYLERFYIKNYKAKDKEIGYNLADGGDGCNYWLGRHRTEETKKKISVNARNYQTEETRIKISNSCKGMQNRKGSKVTDQTKQKMRVAHLNKKYKPMSEEGKQNIREAIKGKHRIYENEEHTKWHME